MNENLIDNPMKTINILLKLGIGDEGRLLYLKNSLKTGRTIYKTDKKFLQKMHGILEQINTNSVSSNRGQKDSVFQQRNRENNRFGSTSLKSTHNRSDPLFTENSKVIRNQAIGPDLEKILGEISQSLLELNQTQSKVLTNLGIVINDYDINSISK